MNDATRAAVTGDRMADSIDMLQPLPLAVRRHTLVREVDRQLARCGLTKIDGASDGVDAVEAAPPRLVIAVSGGPDSVALLLACLALGGRKKRQSRPFEVIVAHVNHHLRDSADADAAWVVDLCRRLKVALHLEDVHPATVKGNVSANARRLRYRALAEVARRVGARWIGAAHHAEDQSETMLMALCRGAGQRGLAGMSMTRRMGEITLARPLLNVRKGDCEDLCRKAGIAWREDPSNADVTKRRARLRRDVMPVLEELWPGAAKRAAAGAEVLAAAFAALQREVEAAFGLASATRWPRERVKTLERGVIASGLRRAALSARPRLPDRLSNRTLMRAAEAIRSDDRRPREFRWADDLTLRVASREVELTSSRA